MLRQKVNGLSAGVIRSTIGRFDGIITLQITLLRLMAMHCGVLTIAYIKKEYETRKVFLDGRYHEGR